MKWISIWEKFTCICSFGKILTHLVTILQTRLFLFLDIEDISVTLLKFMWEAQEVG